MLPKECTGPTLGGVVNELEDSGKIQIFGCEAKLFGVFDFLLKNVQQSVQPNGICFKCQGYPILAKIYWRPPGIR